MAKNVIVPSFSMKGRVAVVLRPLEPVHITPPLPGSKSGPAAVVRSEIYGSGVHDFLAPKVVEGEFEKLGQQNYVGKWFYLEKSQRPGKKYCDYRIVELDGGEEEVREYAGRAAVLNVEAAGSQMPDDGVGF